MRRELGNGFEVDDDKARIDRAEVHRFLSEESYWAKGRPRETQDRLIDEAHASSVSTTAIARSASAARSPTASPSPTSPTSMCSPTYRGRGLGEALVREMVENGPHAHVKWLLHTTDMHPLYRKLGFGEPSQKVMERDSTRNASESG